MNKKWWVLLFFSFIILYFDLVYGAETGVVGVCPDECEGIPYCENTCYNTTSCGHEVLDPLSHNSYLYHSNNYCLSGYSCEVVYIDDVGFRGSCYDPDMRYCNNNGGIYCTFDNGLKGCVYRSKFPNLGRVNCTLIGENQTIIFNYNSNNVGQYYIDNYVSGAFMFDKLKMDNSKLRFLLINNIYANDGGDAAGSGESGAIPIGGQQYTNDNSASLGGIGARGGIYDCWLCDKAEGGGGGAGGTGGKVFVRGGFGGGGGSGSDCDDSDYVATDPYGYCVYGSCGPSGKYGILFPNDMIPKPGSLVQINAYNLSMSNSLISVDGQNGFHGSNGCDNIDRGDGASGASGGMGGSGAGEIIISSVYYYGNINFSANGGNGGNGGNGALGKTGDGSNRADSGPGGGGGGGDGGNIFFIYSNYNPSSTISMSCNKGIGGEKGNWYFMPLNLDPGVGSNGSNGICVARSRNTCGNGNIDTGEQCDGMNLGYKSCIDFGFSSGNLKCYPSEHPYGCTYDISECIIPMSNCGNGNIDSGEFCDGSNLNGMSCVSLGFNGGVLNCFAPSHPLKCHFNSSGCYYTQPYCGDGVVNPGEQCDFNLTSNSWMTRSCNSINGSFSGGVASCIPGSCLWNLSACSRCGNGVIDPGEECDGFNLGNASCLSQGFSQGSPTCTSSCTLNYSSCLYTFANAVYSPTTNGCNPVLKNCGRNGVIDVIVVLSPSDVVTFANADRIDITLQNIPQLGFSPCSVYIKGVINSTGLDFIQFSYSVNASKFDDFKCFNANLNQTKLSAIKKGTTFKSNIFNGYTPGFILSECGDGQIDNILSNPPYVEQCDFNLTSNSWMTSSCAVINNTYSGGIASCNPINCKWNLSSCYRCGDGVVNPGEECDDANLNNYDICNNTCKKTFCGNNATDWPNGLFSGGLLRPWFDPEIGWVNRYGFEECDDANLNNYDRCVNNCTNTFCGDSKIQWPNGRLSGGLFREWSPDGEILTYDYGFEECDDGLNNSINGTCNNCVKTFCGDGIIQWPNGRLSNGTRQYYPPEDKNVFGFEECDDANLNNNDRCANNCTKTFCGDGIIQWPNGNNQFETCEPLLNGSKCDPTTCRFGFCGDGKVQDGEECDNGAWCGGVFGGDNCMRDNDCAGSIHGEQCIVGGNGCSSFCTINDCTIDYVKINPVCENGNVCGAGEVLNVDVGFYGPKCDLVNLVQTDYKTRGDPLCVIQYRPLQGQLKGITYRGSIMGGVLSYEYFIPNITEQCAGQTLSITDTAFYQSNKEDEWIQRSSNILTVDNAEVVLDRCKQFGSVQPYYNYGVYGFDVITNILTNCYYMTCVNSNAFNVRAFADDDKSFGVSLIDSFGVSRTYYCDSNFEDYVCPDDFEYLGSCRQGYIEGGVCTSKGRPDVDCSVKTLMKCGSVRLINGSIVKACNVPNPAPAKFCYNSNDCVYANESSGLNPVCVGFNSSVNNSINKPIVCSSQNTFCPDGYVFNGSFCVNRNVNCNVNCSNVTSVIKFVSNASLLKVNPEWYYYLNNSGCFLTNNDTGRRFSYCGLKYVWPELIYSYMPVGVVYFRFDWDTGTWQRVD